MNQKTILIIIVVLVLGGVGYFFIKSPLTPTTKVDNAQKADGAFDLYNQTFTIDGESVTLKNGLAEREAAPGSATKVVTRYFGNEIKGDLTRDGQDDIAYLVSRETGGTGVFYYAVVAVKTALGYKTTNAFFVGDRIAPQNNYIVSNELNINYAERRPGEEFSVPPSQGAVLLLKVTPDGVLEGLMK